jgi:hypothetical protein
LKGTCWEQRKNEKKILPHAHPKLKKKKKSRHFEGTYFYCRHKDHMLVPLLVFTGSIVMAINNRGPGEG